MTILSDKDYESIKHQPDIYSWQDILIKVKGEQYLDSIDHEKKILASRISQYSKSVKIQTPRLKANIVDSITYIPGDYSILLEYYSRAICMKEIRVTTTSVRIWLSLFTIYPEFSGYFKKYLLNPDKTILVIGDNCESDEKFCKVILSIN